MTRLCVAAVALLCFAFPSLADAEVPMMMPSQASMDSPMPGSGMGQGTWSDMAGGLTARPYIKSLAVVNGGSSTTVFSGGIDAAASVPVGGVTAVISATNLCAAGQTPEPGRCYATPNRVGISFGYNTPQGLGLDFSSPSVPLLQTVNADTIFDVVIALNTLGKPLRWSWVNGDLVSWKASGLGNDDAEIRLRVKPVLTPAIDWSAHGPVGCTATPIRDCSIDRADGKYLGAQMVLSLDDSLSSALTGAVFATRGAIAGFLEPGGSSTSPTLDLQIASSHLATDGTPQTGVLQAFLPASALLNLYGVVPEDATAFFSTTRRGDAGSQSAPVFAARSESPTDNAGVLVTIEDITFSAPTYRVARAQAALKPRASIRGKAANLSVKPNATCKKKACTITVYKLTSGVGAKATKVASGKSDKAGKLAIAVPVAKLPKGSTYVVSVRKGKTALGSARAKL